MAMLTCSSTHPQAAAQQAVAAQQVVAAQQAVAAQQVVALALAASGSRHRLSRQLQKVGYQTVQLLLPLLRLPLRWWWRHRRYRRRRCLLQVMEMEMEMQALDMVGVGTHA